MTIELPETLKTILELRRPAGGKGVKKVKKLITDIICEAGYTVLEDIDGNLICTTTFNHVLFSCHTDAVHQFEGYNKLVVDKYADVVAYAAKPGETLFKRTQLGADDGVGIYLMLEMIKADIEGTYVFHADEEIGCIGSRALSNEAYSIDGYDLEEDFTHAIAFDRKGTKDLISVQLSERMCSWACAEELGKRLNEGSLQFTEAEGVVTDTAMYADLVPECINLSVGYYEEHTYREHLDLNHVMKLRDHILDYPNMFNDLPVIRVPMSEENYDDDNLDYDIVRPDTIASLCHNHPIAISQFLETLGYDFDELFEVLTHESLID